MKKLRLAILAVVILAFGLFAFRNGNIAGSIRGSVIPPDGAIRVWALSNTDTLRATLKDGAFEIGDLKAGTYRLIIEAKPPYKNATKENVAVAEGQPTDVGEIKLEQ